jgi:Family of unknown function (DUF6328)
MTATRSHDQADDPPAAEKRGETQPERLDRNASELVQEVRVAAVGIQVLFAFLLVVPFQTGWKHVTGFDQDVYYVTLVSIEIAAALLIAPSIHHRLLFRRGQKAYLVEVGNRLVILAIAFLTVGFTGILVLISNVIFGGAVGAIAGALTATGLVALWFGVPLIHRRKVGRFPERAPG